MDNTYKKLVDEHKRRLDKCPFFKCAACSSPKPVFDAAGIRVYVPKDGWAIGSSRPATYVLCKECATKPFEHVEFRVVQSLAKAGAFS